MNKVKSIGEMELLDMNDDCLEQVFKLCDPESLVSVSQTCKQNNRIAKRLFKFKTSYHCLIGSKEDENRVKRTISAIGNHLTELNFRASDEYSGLDGAFFLRLSQKCPNLRILEISSRVSPNEIMENVLSLKHLVALSVFRSNESAGEDIDEVPVMRVARSMKQLGSFTMFGVEWDDENIIEFVRTAQKLKNFSCQFNELPFTIHDVHLEQIKTSEDPDETFSGILAAFPIFNLDDEELFSDDDDDEPLFSESDDSLSDEEMDEQDEEADNEEEEEVDINDIEMEVDNETPPNTDK